MPARGGKTKTVAEFGDFQTPPALAMLASQRLAAELNLRPRSILEPTCGRGAFLAAATESFPDVKKVVGIEINDEHLNAAKAHAWPLGRSIALEQGDFFRFDWACRIQAMPEPLLITGNPPWVTSAALGTLSSYNLPAKSNFQKHAGIEAITGKSNFDISEWMLLQYLDWLKYKSGIIAVLCKTAVARKVLTHIWKKRIPTCSARIYRIDALAHFGAAVDACFFVVEFDGALVYQRCEVFNSLTAPSPSSSLGFHEGHIVTDAEAFDRLHHLLGRDAHYVWRSGVKHDCSRVMELARTLHGLENGLGEIADLEADFLYPLLKSSDVGNRRLDPRREMLVTQRLVGEDTRSIKRLAPRTWKYLQTHAELLRGRGSVIYKGKPDFSIFGVGPYTFAPWKVAISGLYKALNFITVGPVDGRPTVFDDTVNFIPCASQSEADFLVSMLESDDARAFLNAMIHWDEKRPITIDVLRRLNLRSLAGHLGRERDYQAHASNHELPLLALA